MGGLGCEGVCAGGAGAAVDFGPSKGVDGRREKRGGGQAGEDRMNM